jgi:tetratricopeptide (TPR) repeat protein
MKLLMKISIALGTVAIIASCGPKPPPAPPAPEAPVMTTAERLELAGAYLDRGRVGDAAGYYQEVLKEEPRSFEANLNLGIALMTMEDARFANERDYSGVQRHFLAAKAARPDDARPYIHLGSLAFKSKDYRSAIENLSVATSLDPGSEPAHEMLAISFIEVGLDEAGREELIATLAINSTNEVANFEMGKIYEGESNNEAAMLHLEQALEVNPNLDMATWLLERIYYDEGLYDRAEATCKRFLRFHPEDIQSLEILGWIYTRQARSRDMVEIYTSLTNIEPDNTGYWSPLVQHYMEREDFAGARPILERSLKHNPYYAYGNVRYGQVLMHYGDESLRNGNVQAAIELFSQARDHLEKAKVDDRYHTTALQLIDQASARIRQASGN